MDFASALIKKRAMVKRLIGMIQVNAIIKHCCSNYLIWKDHNMVKMTHMFLAIRFKIRFRKNFYDKYGYDFKQR